MRQWAHWLTPEAVRLSDPVRLPAIWQAAAGEDAPAAEPTGPSEAELAAAQAEREALRQQAEAQGREAGYRAGYEAGLAEARAALAPALQATEAALRQAREAADRLSEWARLVGERATWAAAADLARAALDGYWQAQPEAFAVYVAQVAGAGPSPAVAVWMGQDAFARWQRALEHLDEADRRWRAALDPALPGDAIVACGDGNCWAAGVGLALARALEAVLSGDG